ncbi:MAG: hypothetical protein J6Y29_03115 [Clostridiales bacterium]|nr:hypothetical protein [Clostridiales bacterium]
MNNFNNIVCPSEAVVSAFDETIYDIKVTVIDAKTKMPIPGIAVSMSGISKDGIYFSTMAKSNSDGSLTFNANKGHFYLDFVSDLFPPEYVLPRRSRISFDTAKTINVLLKLKSATYVDNKLGSVSIEFLDSTNMPYPNISLCLIPTDNASKNIYSVSNTKGISVFKTKPGNYYVDVLKDNFPLNQYRLPDRFNISIEGGTNKKYVIKLVPF